MARLSKEQWAAVRIEWENDPDIDFVTLATRHGVHSANIGRKAKSEGWQKNGKLGAIVQSAQRKADRLTDSHGNASAAVKEIDAALELVMASRQVSEDLRAEVLARHRAEWAELEHYRQTALQEMRNAKQAGDKESWQIAKMAADTCKLNLQSLDIKQESERRAWGLDVTVMPNFGAMSDEQLERFIKTGHL